MVARRCFTIELDADAVSFIEAEMRAGRVTSPADFLQKAVSEAILWGLSKEEESPEFKAWIAEGLAQDARFDSVEADWVTVDQLRETLERRRTERAQGARHAAE